MIQIVLEVFISFAMPTKPREISNLLRYACAPEVVPGITDVARNHVSIRIIRTSTVRVIPIRHRTVADPIVLCRATDEMARLCREVRESD